MNQCSYLSAFSLLHDGQYWCHLAEEPQLRVGAAAWGWGDSACPASQLVSVSGIGEADPNSIAELTFL